MLSAIWDFASNRYYMYIGYIVSAVVNNISTSYQQKKGTYRQVINKLSTGNRSGRAVVAGFVDQVYDAQLLL